MKFLFRERLEVLNSDDLFEFGITKINKNKSEEDLYETEAIFIRNGKVTSRIKLTGLSEFKVVMSSLSYFGSKLRGIAKDESITFDFDGLTFDQYIPINKNLRLIWDE
ncbi:hypothetical protein [Mesorhizobium ciceri]|uniref:hypothetical protein n=1 Tax=Mesorhizobium ciceri TaxID=39645 RepID=UPI0013E8E503|nr:hypothetical protein [Mesorhizobium ciceri]